MNKVLSKYKGKKIFVSGHTGFKGSWMCRLLRHAGADIVGYSIDVPTTPALFELADIKRDMKSYMGDIRDLDKLINTFYSEEPEIVIHMAAQPIVSKSYKEPAETFEVNAMGTVNILECIRRSDSVKSAVIVTTDKVYDAENHSGELDETCKLGGYDPYAASKACAELITSAYRKSFFPGNEVAISTVRAGNVIGGGDFAENRLMPDCIRAYLDNKTIKIRNPHASRPYQHVLDPVCCYLVMAMKQLEDKSLSGAYNIGPKGGSVANEEMVRTFCDAINSIAGKTGSGECAVRYEISRVPDAESFHETEELVINADKISKSIGWHDRWDVKQAVREVAEFADAYKNGHDIRSYMDKCIETYLSD